MPRYIPFHERPPHSILLSAPLTGSHPLDIFYASPDLDPTQPLPSTRQTMAHAADGPESAGHGESNGSFEALREGSAESGPSRKRARAEDGSDGQLDAGAGAGAYRPREAAAGGAAYQPRQRAPPPQQQRQLDIMTMHIVPSIFGISPRNEFTKTVGEFIMANCRGRENIEVSSSSYYSTRVADDLTDRNEAWHFAWGSRRRREATENPPASHV